ASGSPRRCAAASRPTPWFRSIVIPFRRNSPRACAGTTNGWGAANDDAVPGLGITPVADGGARGAGRRGRTARVGLKPGTNDARGEDRLRSFESAGIDGPGAHPA